MTRFVFQGSGHTTGPDGKTIGGIAAAVVIGALVFESAKGAAATIGSMAVIGATAFVTLAAVAAVTAAAVKLRGRRTPALAGQRPVLMRTRPDALPAPERRAIAAPVPTVVNVNLDASFLAAMFSQQAPQAVRVIPEPEQMEIQQ